MAAIASLQIKEFPSIKAQIESILVESIQNCNKPREAAKENKIEVLKLGQEMIQIVDIKYMLEQQVKEALAQSKGTLSLLKDRPYPEEYNLVSYSKVFVPPLFKYFDGIGNLKQHPVCFRANYCNT